MGWDHAMHGHRIATAALVGALAIAGVACGGSGPTQVAADHDGRTVTPAAADVTTTSSAPTTSTTAPAPAATSQPAPAVVTPTPAEPTHASIEVDYQPSEGSTASATLSGPNGTHSKSLDSGAAIFGGLPAGTYSVSVTVDSPSGDPSVGAARVILNGGTLDVADGQHGVVTCDDTGCSGVLSD